MGTQCPRKCRKIGSLINGLYSLAYLSIESFNKRSTWKIVPRVGSNSCLELISVEKGCISYQSLILQHGDWQGTFAVGGLLYGWPVWIHGLQLMYNAWRKAKRPARSAISSCRHLRGDVMPCYGVPNRDQQGIHEVLRSAQAGGSNCPWGNRATRSTMKESKIFEWGLQMFWKVHKYKNQRNS